MIDDDVADHGPGSHVAIPDGAVHAFEALGAEPCRMLILNAPGLMHERFFTGLGQPVPDDTTEPPVPDGPPDLARVAAMAQ